MKKRLVAIFAATAVMVAGVFGCGGDDYSKCITVGQYMGLEIAAIDTSVSDEELQDELDFLFREDVRDGDYINLDFTGYIDGETFEGGSTEGEGYDLAIGSNSFIDGFEEGLIGAKIGETRTLDLTFPDDYDEDLAGKDVQFVCTINSIEYVEAPALTLEYVTEKTEYKTIDEYKESIRAELIAYNEEEALSVQNSELYQKVMENCEVKKYPKDLIERHTQEAKDYYQSMLDYYVYMYYYMYGMEFTTADVMSMMGITEEQMNKECEEAAYDSAKAEMLFTVIADKEGIKVSDSEFEEALAEYMTSIGAETAEKFYEESGYTEELLRKDILINKVGEFLFDNAIIK